MNYGPAEVTLFGVTLPILPLALSLLGLVLVRMIAPPPTRKLTFRQDMALTGLLGLILIAIVSGAFSDRPLGVGMALVWAIGLGFSGMIVVEVAAKRIQTLWRVLIGAGYGDEK